MELSSGFWFLSEPCIFYRLQSLYDMYAYVVKFGYHFEKSQHFRPCSTPGHLSLRSSLKFLLLARLPEGSLCRSLNAVRSVEHS